MSDAADYLFGGGLEDDLRTAGRSFEDALKSTGRKIDDVILQPVVSQVDKIADNPMMLAAIAVNIAYPGLGSVIGQSLLGSAAATLGSTATAIFGNTLLNTALNGGNIKAGLLTAVGGELGKLGAGEVAKFAKLADVGDTVGKALAAGTENAIRSGASALIRGTNPLEEMIRGGIAAGLSTAMLTEVSNAIKDVPGISAITSDDPFARAARSALSAAAAGESGAKAFVASGFGSLVSLGKDYFGDVISADADAPVIESGNKLKEARANYDFQVSGRWTKPQPSNAMGPVPINLADYEQSPYSQAIAKYKEAEKELDAWKAAPDSTEAGYTRLINSLAKMNESAKEANEAYEKYVKPAENTYNSALNDFESKVGKFQTQEAVNTTFLLNTFDTVKRVQDTYKEARGQPIPDDALADYMPKITRTDLSPPDPESLTRLIQERDVKRLNPWFDPEIYVKVNDLKTSNPYKDYLDFGWKEGRVASRGDLGLRIAEQRERLLSQAADAAGLASPAQLAPEVAQQISRSLDERNGTDLTKWQDQQLKSWDDIKGLKFVDPVMIRSGELKIDVSGIGTIIGRDEDSREALREGFAKEMAKAGPTPEQISQGFYRTSLRLGTPQEQLEEKGYTLTLPSGQRVYVVDEGDNPVIESKPTDAVDTVKAIQKSSLVPDSVKKSVEDILYSIQTRESNLPKVVPQFIKDAWDQTQTAQGVGMKAFGNIIQSFNGLVSLAGINPKTTPVGKFAESMIELGKAKTSEEYRSAVAAMDANLAGAKGMAGAAKAIWQNFKNTPVEFLSEVVISEGLQEIVPLLIGGGATTFAKGIALARGMGTTAAQRIGTRTGLAAAGVSDIAESAGGSAAGAFEQAYEIATKQLGKSEAEATQIALDIAARSGAFSALVTATTLGLGGAALEKAILGGSGKGAFANALDEIGSAAKLGTKITIKEGVAEGGEEGLTTAFTEGQLYKLDPNRDVAANIASSAILGAIAGGGISGGAYGFSAGRDIVSNVLSTNPQVRQVIDNAPDAATAERELGALGVPQQTNANLLNDRFDTEYVSSQEAYNALRSDPNFTPTETDVSQFVGKRPEADLSSEVAKYIDPRVVDETEARAAFREIGIENPTQEELAKYIGQNPELDTIRTIQSVIGPQATTRSEAEALFKQQGYTPTPEEIGRFTGRISDDKARTDIGAYIAPRQVTQQEVVDELSRLGYTAKRRPTSADATAAQNIALGRAAYNPIYDYDGSGEVTAADVLELTRASRGVPTSQPAASTPWGADEVSQFVRTGQNVSQEDVMREVANFANPRVVTADEVKKAAAAEGYMLSDEDARKLAGQKDEATALQQIRSTYDPLAVTAEEARAAFQAQGYTPTTDELNKYVGVKNEASTLSDIASFANPRAVTQAEAQQFFRDLGYTPSQEELAQFVKQADQQGVLSAVRSYVDPRQVTQAEAEKAFRDLGYTPTKDELSQFVKQGTDVQQTQVLSLLNEYVGPRQVTAEEVRAAYSALGFPEPLDADVNKLVGQYAQSELAGKAQAALPTATYNKLTKTVTDAIAGVKMPASITKQDVTDAIAAYMTANPGLNSQDVADAIANYMKTNPQLTKTDLSTAITTATANFATKNDIATAIANIKFPAGISKADVTQAITDYMAKNPGLSTKNVADAIATYMKDNPPITKADVSSAITTATATFATKNDINTAIANIKFPAGLTKEDVSSAISDYLTKNPGLSTKDVANTIATYMKDNPPVTKADISSAITTATANFATKTDIDTAISNIKFPAGISKADVSTAITEYMAKNPGLQTKDVAAAIASYMQDNPPLTKTDVSSAITAATANFATKSDIETAIANIKFPAGLTKEDVSAAISKYMKDNPGLSLADVATKITEATAGLATSVGVKTEIANALSGYATKSDIETAISNIQFPPGLSRKDVTDVITQYMEDNPGLNAADVTKVITDYMKANPPVSKADVQSIVQTAGDQLKNDLAQTETTILAEVAKNEAAGLKRDEALEKAISDVAAAQGKDVAALTKQIADSQSALGKEIETLSAALSATENSILAEVAKNEAAGLKRDEALQKAISDVATAQGKDVAALTKQIADSQSALGKEITSLGTTLAATEQSILAEVAKNEAAGLSRDQALQKAIADVAAAQGKDVANLTRQITESQSALGKEITALTTQIGGVETRLTEAIAAARAAGLEGDAALQVAINTVAVDLGTTKSQLLSQLGTTEARLKADFASQLTGVSEQVLTVENRLSAAIEAAKQAGLAGDAALQSAITTVAQDLGTTRANLLSQIGKTEAELKTTFRSELQTAQDAIFEQMQLYEDAGIARDEALDLAINKVAKDLGTTAKSLTDQITGVQQLVGRPQIEPTQADLDYLTQALQQGTTPDLTYDVTGDKKVDEQDRLALYNYIMRVPGEPPAGAPAGTPGALPTFAPSLESRWAPTGIYGALARQQQELVRQEEETRRQAAAQARTGLRQQRMGQFMNILGQAPDLLSQQVQVKAPDPSRIGYIYDWSSIFATPGQQAMFASPFAEGGTVDEDELIRYLRG